MSYTTYLKLFGYRGIIKKPSNNIVHNITIDDTHINDSIRQLTNNWYENDIFRSIINSIYPIFITLILLWIPIYSLIQAIVVKDIQIFIQNFFSFLFVIQFIHGREYYKTNHIDTIYELHNNTSPDKYYMVGISISIIVALIMFALMINGFTIEIYTKLYNDAHEIQKIFICILLILEKTFAHATFVINMINFTFVFTHHSNQVSIFETNLDIKMNKSEILDMSTIISEYQELKDNHSISITKWNNMFSNLILFGIIGIYFTVINYQVTKSVQIVQCTYMGYFIVIDMLYLLIINKMKNGINNILELINLSKFTSSYRNNSIMDDIKGNYHNTEYNSDNISHTNKDHETIEHLKNMIFRIMIKSHENNFSNEWLILNGKLQQEWKYFSILGFELRDTSLVKKCIAVLIAFFMASNLNYQLEWHSV